MAEPDVDLCIWAEDAEALQVDGRDDGGCTVRFGASLFGPRVRMSAAVEAELLARLQARQKVLQFPKRGDNFRRAPADQAERAVALVREVADAMTAPSPDSAA